jgi:hypothetical protein
MDAPRSRCSTVCHVRRSGPARPENVIFCTGKRGAFTKQMEAAAMRLHAYRDENRSAHVELMGGGDHPWTIDLVTLVALVILVAGFAGALVAQVL